MKSKTASANGYKTRTRRPTLPARPKGWIKRSAFRDWLKMAVLEAYAQGHTQTAFADVIGITSGHISAIIHGRSNAGRKTIAGCECESEIYVRSLDAKGTQGPKD